VGVRGTSDGGHVVTLRQNKLNDVTLAVIMTASATVGSRVHPLADGRKIARHGLLYSFDLLFTCFLLLNVLHRCATLLFSPSTVSACNVAFRCAMFA
jgi:hypothetical protein